MQRVVCASLMRELSRKVTPCVTFVALSVLINAEPHSTNMLPVCSQQIYEFILCNPASEDLSEILNINQQFSFYHSSFIYFLFNGRSVLYYCSQPLDGDIDASTFSLDVFFISMLT